MSWDNNDGNAQKDLQDTLDVFEELGCKHDFEEIDRIGCMYHVGLGCEDVMEQCKKCNEVKTFHSMKNAKMSLGE